MDEKTIDSIFHLLRKAGYEILPGISKERFNDIEAAYDCIFPPDLKDLLCHGVPNDVNLGDFPNWHTDVLKIKSDHLTHIKNALLFDIRENNYWHDAFGVKATEDAEVERQVSDTVESWPVLIPIYGHRYLPSSPNETNNPVISLWQATDSVYYGKNLADYFVKEFDSHSDAEMPLNKEYKHIEPWSSVLGLE